MKKKLLFISLILIPIIVMGFVDPYARRIRPFTSVPSSCAENEIGYSMTLHTLHICTNTGYKSIDFGGVTTYAPIGAKYIVQTADSDLTAEQSLGALATGLLKNSTTTGILSIAVAGTDYQVPLTAGDVTTSGATSTIGATKVTNAMLAGSIAYSKLSLTGAILNADLAGSIAYSKLVLTGAILNADLAGSIAASKFVGSDIATVGTITSGIWNGTIINSTYGGTGINNAGRTLTINTNSGTITFSGASKTLTIANNITLTATDGSTLVIGGGGTLGTAAYTASSAYEVPITFSSPLVRTTNNIACSTCEVTGNKDATGGYAGLTLFKIDFKNAANTFTSFFTNANTAARTYTFQDRNGTITDDTDLALKAALANPTFTGTVVLPLTTVSVGNTTSAQTDLLINPTTKASGNLFNLAVNGSSKFSVDFQGVSVNAGSFQAGSLGVGATPSVPLDIRASGGTNLFNFQATTGTNAAYGVIVNTAGTAYFGNESSAGGTMVTGATAYALILRPASGKVIQFGKSDGSAVTATFSDTGQTFVSLAGTGSRAVVADANGLLSAPVSDEMLKEPLRALPESYGIDMVMSLKPSIFKYLDKNRFGSQDYLGFGARETSKILPEVTGQMKDGTYYLTDEKLVVVLTKAIQQQQKEIEELRKDINELKKNK